MQILVESDKEWYLVLMVLYKSVLKMVSECYCIMMVWPLIHLLGSSHWISAIAIGSVDICGLYTVNIPYRTQSHCSFWNINGNSNRNGASAMLKPWVFTKFFHQVTNVKRACSQVSWLKFQEALIKLPECIPGNYTSIIVNPFKSI